MSTLMKTINLHHLLANRNETNPIESHRNARQSNENASAKLQGRGFMKGI